ncbi:MAG: dihydroneopterin aldolase [Paludibacteraceae bacterium]
MSKIVLKNMKFHAYHGCLDFEKEQGNTFFVTLTIELDTGKAEKTDNLTDTLNYQEVYNVIKVEMETPSDLIEHVSRRICDAVQQSFPQINSLQIELSKLHPPLGGEVEFVSVIIGVPE